MVYQTKDSDEYTLVIDNYAKWSESPAVLPYNIPYQLVTLTTNNKQVSLVYTVDYSDEYTLVIDNYAKWSESPAKVWFSLVLLRNNFDVKSVSESVLCDFPNHKYPPQLTGDDPPSLSAHIYGHPTLTILTLFNYEKTYISLYSTPTHRRGPCN